MSDKHGRIDGDVRLCDEHGKHGPLYLCAAYTPAAAVVTIQYPDI